MEQNQSFMSRTDCEICGSETCNTLFSCQFTEDPTSSFLRAFYSDRVDLQRLAGGLFEVAKCQQCGFIWQKYVLGQRLMLKLYEEWIAPDEAHDRALDQPISKSFQLAQEAALIGLFFGTPPREIEVLDFGMGWGSWCLMAKAFGYQAWGTELSQKRILYAKEQGIDVMSWEDIGDHKFHFINAEQVFEHISQPLETLRYLVNSLNPGGLIHLSVPDGRNIERKLARGDWMAPKGSAWSLNPVSPLEHINCFTHASLTQMANRVGLQRARIPLLEIAASQKWSSPAAIARNALRPFYRCFFGTNLLFRK